MTRSLFRFGPLEIDRVGLREATEWILQRAQAGSSSVVVTSNIQHLRLAHVDQTFRDVVARADLHVADGWPLVAASRLLGSPVPHVPGIDLVEGVLARGRDLRIAILGGREGAAERLAAKLRERHAVVLVDPLPKGRWNNEAGRARLHEAMTGAHSNLVLVGIGAPSRELLAHELRTAVEGPILCCGAAVDVLAGETRRAPAWLRRLRLEWLYRVVSEPRRLAARYLTSGWTYLQVLARELIRRSRRA